MDIKEKLVAYIKHDFKQYEDSNYWEYFEGQIYAYLQCLELLGYDKEYNELRLEYHKLIDQKYQKQRDKS